MANRQTTFLIKRSNVPGKVPPASGLTSGELALNTADAILYTSGSTANQILPIGWDRIHRSGDTVTGDFVFNGGISATTISAATYYNLPQFSGDYLPLSGGTVYGDTYFTSGLTASTLTVTGLTQTYGITSTGGVTFKQVTVSSTYTATTEDFLIDASGGTFTIYLPSAVGIQGRLLDIKNNGGGAVTVQPIFGEDIDGKPFVILGETNALQLASNGSNWVALGYNISTVNSSTGVFEFTGLTVTSPTTFTVAPVKGWIVDDTTNPLSPQLYYLSYTGGTYSATYVTASTETWVYLTSGGTISQLNIPLTEQQRRQNIFLGKISHPSKTTIVNTFSQPDYVLSPLSQLRDMFTPINLVNGGIRPSANGTNLSFNTSSGYLYGLGINFANDTLNPDTISVSGTSPCTFQYRTQTGGTTSNVTLIDPTKYDVGGIVTPLTGTKATNQRIYLLQNGDVRVQYGQVFYSTLAQAVAGIATEQFVEFSNFTSDAILIGILSVLSTATDLSDTTKALFFNTSKFGDASGAAGGTPTTNLQQAYNNSINPEIITNSTLDGVQIKGGTGNDNDKNFIIENNTGTQTAYITASGDSLFHSVSATTFYGDGSNLTGIPNYYVTGGTYSSGTLTLNRQDGSVTITGFTSDIVYSSVTANTIYTDYIDFNTGATVTQSQGRISWDSGTGTLNVAVGDAGTGLIDLQVGQEEIVRVYNSEATTLLKGEIVYVFGSQGNRPSVKRAIATSDGYSVTTLGMVSGDITSGSEGYVTTFGIISNLNTLGLTGGTPIFLSPTVAGGYTSTKPKAPEHIVLIGYVVRVNATTGSIFINISNGWELDEIHDVRISAATQGDLLMYSSYSGSPVWVNTKTLTGDYRINSISSNTISDVTTLSFNDLHTGTTAVGQLTWNTSEGTLNLGMFGGNVTQQIGLENYYQVINTTVSSGLTNGSVIASAGIDPTTDKIVGTYMIADGSQPYYVTLGIATEDIISGNTGYVNNFGIVRDIDTTGTPYGETWLQGDILYVSPTIPGGLTNVVPESPNLKIQIAIVLKLGVTDGSLFVRPELGYGLGDLHNTQTTGQVDGDLMFYSGSSSTWVYGKTLPSNYTINGTLNVNTLSASTYLNLPTDIYVTGATYNDSNTFTFTNNTGGTFSTSFDIVSGLTSTGTISSSVLSAATYLNLPTDIYVTGATYNDNNTFTFTNSTGGTFSTSFDIVSGLTINGDLLITGVTSASTFNITSTPNTNTTADSVLVRNTTTGDIENRSINSLINTNNTITVALTGSTGVDFNSIKSAVESITGSSSANTYTVKVAGGVYNEDPFRIPTWVAVVGDSSVSTIINANDPSQTLINLSDQSALFDCQVQGCTGTSVSAILYSSSTTPQSAAISYVENVRFGSNYTHAKVVAYGGANIIMQCSNVKYGGYPFTVGFYATNSGSGIGRMQLRNVTSTNGGIVTTTGLIFAKADAASCGFIVNGCLLTKAVGAAAGTGFYVENGGFLRLTAVNFQRWAIGIDAPQIGSAPSIDAIALNFENNTTDVNIVHSGATGKIQGTDNFLKTNINIDAPLYEVNQDPRSITVDKKGGDFSSIKDAVDYLFLSASTSSDNRFVIEVGPGQFAEDEIDLTNTPYVSIVGSNIQTTQILPRTNTQHILKIGQNNEVSFLSFSGAPAGYSAIYCYDIGDFGQAHKCSFYDCDTNVWVEAVTQDTKFYGEYLDFNGEYTYGTKAISTGGFIALANMENYYNFPEGTGITVCNYATGSGATLSTFVGDNISNGVSGSTAYYVQDGAGLYASTITVDGFTYGIYNPNVGDGVRFDVDNASMVNNTWDLYVERTTSFGTFGGSANHEKIYTQSPDVYWLFLDIEDGELDITRKASVTFQDGTHTDFTTLIFEGSTMGLMEGGEITVVSGLTISTAAGFGYLEKFPDVNVVKRIDWDNSQITLPANDNQYIYINENGILSNAGNSPNTVYNILLGRVVTNSTDVEFIDLSPAHSDHTSNRFGYLFRNALGPIYATGSIVNESTTPFELNVSSGEYYYSSNTYMPAGGTGLTFTQYYRNGTGSTWVTSATTLVNNSQYDNNGTLTGLTSGYYTKHTLYVVGDSTYENYFLVLGQNEYSTLVEAEDALLPTPPTYFTDSVSQIASIYVQQGFSAITQIQDIRPVIGFKAGGVNASSVHGNLLGLGADDHTQYLLVDGARAMTGDLVMGTNDIISAGTINGVTIESHATRHQFGGADPVGSVTPGPNYIPYADVSGTLDEWVSTASTTTLGKVKISATPLLASDPIAVGTRDNGYLKSITGFTYGSNVLSGTSVDGTVTTTTVGLRTKAGSVAGTSFAGNPKKVTVTFTTPYPNTNYSISIVGGVNRTFTYETKTTTGFVINSNANTAFVENVDWMTIAHGES